MIFNVFILHIMISGLSAFAKSHHFKVIA